MGSSFLKKECDLHFFHDRGYSRKQCSSCGAYFWTLDEDAELCGDKPCVEFSFIDNPLTKEALSLSTVREEFLSFFEQHNHSRLHYPVTGERYPVVARWRPDIYLTIASIADFQPHVTSGEVPPPANPLVISQPCIRLNDLDEIGVSGRHLSTFEMMGHHAFNKNTDEIYWKEETLQYCDDFFKKRIGILPEAIRYKEQLWDGGGNAGPCLEVLAGGLELATLVFMNMKKDPSGDFDIKGKNYTQNPLNIVDTGYGLERIAWATHGTPTIYETVFPTIVQWLQEHTHVADKKSLYSLADHSKCLAFLLGDGVVPSNVREGYLARLIIRRSLRFIKHLNLNISLKEIVARQLELLKNDFPSLIQQKQQIEEILESEADRYRKTISKGKSLVQRVIQEQGSLQKDDLIDLYDTHGMPPEEVQNIAKEQGVSIVIPENFDSMVADLHSQEEPKKTEDIRSDLPSTECLYNEDHYKKNFTATVLWLNSAGKETEVILDKTVFYPEGGGQPSDVGYIAKDGEELTVTRVEKEGDAVIHIVSNAQEKLETGDKVKGHIDWSRRYTLMKHHTATHLINGALRKVLGTYVWQAGSQLGLEDARFDFTHYKRLSEKETQEIEDLANQYIQKGIPVEKYVLDRNTAEQRYGFRLYQGGVPPGNRIRVLNIPKVDVEACGGTHLNNTREVGKIRVLKTERVQDGVNRVVFAAGKMADAHFEEEKKLYETAVAQLSSRYVIKQRPQNMSSMLHDAADVFSVPVDQLEKTIQRFLDETPGQKGKVEMPDLSAACHHLFEQWKEIQKEKKTVSDEEIQELQKEATRVPDSTVKVIASSSSSEATVIAGALTEEPDYVAHISDGEKIASAASGNVDIDLRLLAPKIGEVLGGSGGGKPKLTQSGGPKTENMDEALRKAVVLTKEAVKKQKNKKK